MKLEDQVLNIKSVVKAAYDETLSISGLQKTKRVPVGEISSEWQADREKLDVLLNVFETETADYTSARDQLIEELAFTFFNQIAALKAMETRKLIPEIILQRHENAGLSSAHKCYIDENPDKRKESFKALRSFLQYEFEKLGERINLYSSEYPFNILPETTWLKKIIDEFNKIEENDLKSHDFLGFCYEYYNRDEKKAFKKSKKKIEYDKVPLSSQIYTPSWVVEFILNNSLGKLWMEMHPDSSMKDRRDIAHIPDEPIRDRKSVEEIKLIDPCCGSGNFFQTAFDMFFEMYKEEGYKDKDIPQKILTNNLYGIDLDDRAIQIAHLGLYIKCLEKNPGFSMDTTNIVSTDFHLPEFDKVKDIFLSSNQITHSLDEVKRIWEDLQQAEKFGSLINLKSKMLPRRRGGQKSLISDDQESNEEKELLELIKVTLRQHEKSNSSRFFIKKKAEQGLNFVSIISNKYDVAVSNPPYTNSGDYGPELKTFVEENYANDEFSFYPNLYACFLKRNSDFIDENGKIGIVSGMTYMFIKTFEDTRKFILNNYHINVFVHFGYLGMFTDEARVDTSIILLETGHDSSKKSYFMKLDTEKDVERKAIMRESFFDYINGKENIHNYLLEQNKFKFIESWPFIYWITQELRDKFRQNPLKKSVDVKTGLSTGDNLRFLRYWWEVDEDRISSNYKDDYKKWVPAVKGGDYKKWYGNLWLVLDWDNEGQILRQFSKSTIRNTNYYFKNGVTSGKSSTKGNAYRFLPENHIFTDASPSLFFEESSNENIYFLLGLLNSSFLNYTIKCLNPTVNTQVGDLERLPFIFPDKHSKSLVSTLSYRNAQYQKKLCELSIVERDYKSSPLRLNKDNKNLSMQDLLKLYLSFENVSLLNILINEAIIDNKVFEMYQIRPEDMQIVLARKGISVGSLPIITTKEISLEQIKKTLSLTDDIKPVIEKFIKILEVQQVTTDKWDKLKQKIEKLYEKSELLEDICLKCKVNPLTLVYILKGSDIIPIAKSQRIMQEFILDQVRSILIEDDDGIAPLHLMYGENTVYDRLIEKLYHSGFSHKDVQFIESLLDKKLDKYLESNFFADECDILNLFPNLPKTPFIWHLSSGKAGGIDIFIIIYKWSRNNLLKVKSVYAQKRKTGLENRLAQLADDESIKAEEEKELIREQLNEIDEFCRKIDKIVSEGYDPVLDDGVGKNIAPLQREGMLKTDVLTDTELEKFLNADW